MTKPTIDEMVEWLGALRCDCDPPRMFDIDPEEMAKIIRDHLLAGQANTLPHWHDGEPPKPYRYEWFIAITSYGDRVVLKSLPEGYSYDYKTADETYIKADKIKKWMQFPDSEYMPFSAPINTLPLDEVPDGWLVDKLSQEDDGWFCCLVKPASPFSDEAYYAYSQEHGEVINISSPTEALRAAIAKVKP